MQIYVHSNSAESHLCLTWEHLSGHQVGWMTCVKVYELHMKAAVWFLWRSSPPPLPSPPLCLSRTLPPPASLSSPLHTHTHPLQQWTEPPADSHGVTLFKSTQPSLPASSAGRPRSSRVLHFGYTLLLLFYTQTDTHTREQTPRLIFSASSWLQRCGVAAAPLR